MRKQTFTILALAALLSGCSAIRLARVSDDQREQISWQAFCQARGYDTDDHTFLTQNEYFDTWCGSIEEEDAFIRAGIKP